MTTTNLEIPDELKKLYRHWEFDVSRFTVKEPVRSTTIVNSNKLSSTEGFARERMQAWINRQNGISPTSNDEIIAKFKFCNIYRELDKQTIIFHTRLRPLVDDFPYWLLNMFACRFFANLGTQEKMGLLKPGAPNKEFYSKLKSLKKPKFGNAYVFPISTIQNSPWPTREEFISLYVSTIIEDVAKEINRKKNRTVNELLECILPIFGFNHRFLWTEVLIDVHYQYPELVDLTKDFYIGPGAKPSLQYLRIDPGIELNRVLNILGSNYKYVEGVNLELGNKKIPFSAENWEGICCEFRKYQNLKAGKGRRRLYRNSSN